MTDFVQDKYSVERNLPKEGVFATTSRSLSVIQKVFRKEELKSLDETKNIILDVLHLTFKPKLKRGDLLKPFQPILPSKFYLIIIFLTFLLPILF